MTLRHGDVALQPLRRRDARSWRQLRAESHEWLAPWEATPPDAHAPVLRFPQLVRAMQREARAGRALPFTVTQRGRMVGQLTVAGIGWGSLRSGHIGYWIGHEFAGRGITPLAVALATDHCLRVVGLHRVEINIRPENAPSLRVVEKLGFRDEGLRERYLHIDGAWRDHRTFALTAEELGPGGLLAVATRHLR
ncbi:GNAT family protein [Angustibacter aerolatus]